MNKGCGVVISESGRQQRSGVSGHGGPRGSDLPILIVSHI